VRRAYGRKKPTWLFPAILAAAVLAAYIPVSRTITAIRLLAVVRRVASGDIDKSPSVQEAKLVRYMGRSEEEAMLYRPSGAEPTSGVVLIAGVSELGCYHPRLVSLSRALAQSGFLVLTPDIRMLREFKIYPPPFEEISFWLHEAPELEGGRRLHHVGLAGISFSGTLALVAAAQPRNSSLAAYVLGIGCFDDLNRCSRFWFGAGPVTVGPGYYPTRYYARWIMMLAAVDMLPSRDDRDFMETALRNLLLQKQVSAPPAGVTDQGLRWYHLATMPEDQADPELAERIGGQIAATLYPQLRTDRLAHELRCPIFLAHGAYDDLIPPEESRALHQKTSEAQSYLLISPFLTHTHPWEKPLGWKTKTSAVFDLFLFFYHLAGAV
jgi:dienelactone hydrolase